MACQVLSQYWPACPFKAVDDDSPLFQDWRLEILNAKRAPPRITPNLMAGMLPVIMNERKPPTESSSPAKCKQRSIKANQPTYKVYH